MKDWVQCCHRQWTRNCEWLPMPAEDWSQRRRTRKTTPVGNLNFWLWSGRWPRSSKTTSWAPSSQSSRTITLWLTWTTPSWEQWNRDGWQTWHRLTLSWGSDEAETMETLMRSLGCPVVKSKKPWTRWYIQRDSLFMSRRSWLLNIWQRTFIARFWTSLAKVPWITRNCKIFRRVTIPYRERSTSSVERKHLLEQRSQLRALRH